MASVRVAHQDHFWMLMVGCSTRHNYQCRLARAVQFCSLLNQSREFPSSLIRRIKFKCLGDGLDWAQTLLKKSATRESDVPAHQHKCVISVRCGIWSLSAQSGHRPSRANQARFMSTHPSASVHRSGSRQWDIRSPRVGQNLHSHYRRLSQRGGLPTLATSQGRPTSLLSNDQ